MDVTVTTRGRRSPSTRLFAEPLAAKVPELTAWFWVVKILTTAAGEATSDALKTLGNVVGGGIEVLLFLIGVLLQFRSRRYTAIAYWFLAGAIATFGTGVADFLHLDVGIPYAGTTLLWALVLAAVFWLWYRSEGTLSIHSITTTRRELYYWATVFATFALGTALGDFTASELGLGYFASAVLFTVVILVPAFAYRWAGMNAIAAFWFAYVVTRPLGASYADYLSKPPSISGYGFGDAPTAIVLGLAIVVCVGYLAVARPDVQLATAPGGSARRHLGGWPPQRPIAPAPPRARRHGPVPRSPGGVRLRTAVPVQPGSGPPPETHHPSPSVHGARLVYVDRFCAGCRRRQMTRVHDGVHLCDACLRLSRAAPGQGAPRGPGQGAPRGPGRGGRPARRPPGRLHDEPHGRPPGRSTRA